MTVRHLYSTNNGMLTLPALKNAHDSAVALGKGFDGRYIISVMGPEGDAWALVDRDELLLIAAAIDLELSQEPA